MLPFRSEAIIRGSLSSKSLIRARFLPAHCVVQRKATFDLRMVIFGLFLFFLISVVWHPRILAKAVLGIVK